MALTNIELYEALKKDVSEDAARMIAEVFPRAEDLATRSDILELRAATGSDIARLEALIKDLEIRTEQRFSAFERRVFRWSMTFAVPLWAALVAALVKFVIQI